MSIRKMARALRRSVHRMHREETGSMAFRAALVAGSLCVWAVMSSFRMSGGGTFAGGYMGGFTLFGGQAAEMMQIDREAREAADEQAQRGTREWQRIYMQELSARMKETETYTGWRERVRSREDEYEYDEVSETYDEDSSLADDGDYDDD